MSSLRNRIGNDEFDYQVSMDALSDYAVPWARVTALLRSGEIIRVKKGLYIFGPDTRKLPVWREPVSLELQAEETRALLTPVEFPGIGKPACAVFPRSGKIRAGVVKVAVLMTVGIF